MKFLGLRSALTLALILNQAFMLTPSHRAKAMAKGFPPTEMSLQSSLEMMSLIRQEMVGLDAMAGFKSEVRLTDSDTSASEPDNTIAISHPQLNQIRASVEARNFRPVVRFLLAHEKWHQVQYRTYTPEAVRTSDSERRRIYEAQADILAGKYLMETLNSTDENDMAATVAVLKLVFELGAQSNRDSGHPTKEARRIAARLGMALGLITALPKSLGRSTGANSISALREKIDMAANESIMDWSYRLSKKVIHYNVDAAQHIEVEKNPKIHWDEHASNPFVTFEYVYKNTGTRTIHVDMEIQCVAVPRENSDDTLEWVRASTKNYRFDLRPNQRYTARGRLRWLATEDLMPRLVAPPRYNALMSTEYVP